MVFANLSVRFIVELVGVCSVGYWGFTASDDTVIRLALAIGGVAGFAVVWGLLLAPTARSGLTAVQKDVLGTIVLLMAAGALAMAGQPTAALIYAAVLLVNAGLLFALGDNVARSRDSLGRG
jgi:hypothetical protein